MSRHTRYRLFHKNNKKYVAWPHGRGYVECSSVIRNAQDLMPMLRLENEAWGGTNLLPVLEIHATSAQTAEVRHVLQLSDYDYNAHLYQKEAQKRRAA